MKHDMTLELWLAPEPARLAPALAASWAALLSADERQRWQRYAREEDRNRFLLVRALVRKVLAQELHLQPQELVFKSDSHGKPHVVAPGGKALHFNLSHTRGLSALVLSRKVEVGVDVESLGREVELLALARRYFATPEVLMLEDLAPEPQRELFFALWTLKEAWVKAKGLGLRVPLDEFSFHGPGLMLAAHAAAEAQSVAIGAPGAAAIELHCDPQLLEQADDWSFRLLRRGGFRIAVAAAYPAAQPLRLVLHDANPLLDLQETSLASGQ
jgi:phosphopantetheine--protein transferase-like protein